MTPEYKASSVMILAVAYKTVSAKKGKGETVTHENAIGLIPWNVEKDPLPVGWKSGKSRVDFRTISIGWTRDAGKSFINHMDLLEKYGHLGGIGMVEAEYPKDKE